MDAEDPARLIEEAMKLLGPLAEEKGGVDPFSWTRTL